MYIFKMKIYQPQAHFRIPFTYKRRQTYPIPPYSTIIGLICNLMGIDWLGGDENAPQAYRKLRKIKISISGYFEDKTTEYVWFRTLSKEAHKKRFGTTDNRYVNGNIEHLGGQIPILIDVLNEVRLTIHFAHEDKEFLKVVRDSFVNPINRLDVIHIGRAEDWIFYNYISDVIDLQNTDTISERKGLHKSFKNFFWIPEKTWINDQETSSFFNFEGLIYKLTTFWKIQNFENTYNRNDQRYFNYITAKLNDGLIMTNKSLLYDYELEVPIFLASFSNGGEK